MQVVLSGPGADEQLGGDLRVGAARRREPGDLGLLHGQGFGPARVQLNAALEIFERLRARPWIDRASAELRATGQSKPRAGDSVADRLTAQELEVARLAASGLTNKQIAERLFLSHRTVSGHLHRAFPKLGVTTRAALRDALAAVPAERLPR